MGTQSHRPGSLPSFSESLPSIGSPSVRPLPLSTDPFSGPTSHIKEIARGKSYRHAMTISRLPDDVLLEIFQFYRKNQDVYRKIYLIWEWHLLVHVCRRWRQIIFASPRRLDVRILCTHRTPVRENLGIWPAFPIVIDYGYSGDNTRPRGAGNVIAALEHPDRVCHLNLNVPSSQLEKMVTLMQEPFPVLTHLNIALMDGDPPVFLDGFLGGSAPCLQEVDLYGIPFPALPTLLLSTSDLVTLILSFIPEIGYIPPEAMIVGLAALPRLETFTIGFQSATPRSNRLRPPPLTRVVLPALTTFQFQGACEYLENFVAQIDSPQLDQICINYLSSNRPVDVQVAQLSKFVDHSVGSKLFLFRHAQVSFFRRSISFTIYRHANHPSSDRHPAGTIISCEGIDWRASNTAHWQVLSQFAAILSNVVHLRLEGEPDKDRRFEGIHNIEWLHLFRQFSTVQTLHVSQRLAGHVALALEDTAGEMVPKVLPSLNLIYLAGQPTSSVEKFVAARQPSGHSVTVVDTKWEFSKRLESYVSK